MNNSISDLQRLFNALMLANYGSSKTINLPFYGGFLTLNMEFNNGMIDLVSATSNFMGLTSACDYFSIGYTCPVGLARSARIALDNFKLDAISAEAQLMRSANDHVSLQVANQVQGV